jgi:hypothetical protein
MSRIDFYDLQDRSIIAFEALSEAGEIQHIDCHLEGNLPPFNVSSTRNKTRLKCKEGSKYNPICMECPLLGEITYP